MKFSGLCMRAWSLSCIHLFGILWTVARQSPLSMGVSTQYWSGLPFPSPEGNVRHCSKCFILIHLTPTYTSKGQSKLWCHIRAEKTEIKSYSKWMALDCYPSSLIPEPTHLTTLLHYTEKPSCYFHIFPVVLVIMSKKSWTFQKLNNFKGTSIKIWSITG